MSFQCQHCGATFFPQSSAWGFDACGDCIADRIELALMGGLFDRDRKPMRRASDLANSAEPQWQFTDTPRKVVGG